jgi:hypothetical protein
MLQQILSIAGWFVLMVVVMSIIEHQVHCRLMHKKPRFFLFRNLTARKRMFTSHAVEHHSQYRKHFHDHPLPHGEDRGIRLNVLEGLVESLPLTVPLFFVSVTGAIMFPVVVCIHHLIWNQIHLEMHQPKKRFFSEWAAFKYVARHHYLHHRYPDKNFNVAFPIGDYLFNTVAKPTAADWEAMREEGIASAGHPRGAAGRAERNRAA